jgi:hypothetical protein
MNAVATPGCSSPPRGALQLESDAGAEATPGLAKRSTPGYSPTRLPRLSQHDDEIPAVRDANDAMAGTDASPLLTLDWFGSAVFHDAQGNEIGRANAPTKFPLPDGGSVTFGIGYETFTFLDVPAGATLRPFIDHPFPVTQQSIRIDVPDRPGMRIVANSGCDSSAGAGVHVLGMNDDCMESSKGELFIYAWQNGGGAYIAVKDIALGPSTLEPLDVALPAWTDLPAGDNRVRLDTKGLPDAVTGDVGLYAVRGHRPVMSTTTTVTASDAGFGVAMVDGLLPSTGTGWVRSASFYPGAPVDFDFAPRSYRTEQLTAPLASPATIDFATLLPLPTDLMVALNDAPTIAFNLAAQASSADVDRVAATFAWGDPEDPIIWHVIAKPTTRRITLPKIPAYLATPEATLLWIEVRAEDHPGVDGWTNVLKDWHDTFLFLSPEQWPPGRISRSVWRPTTGLPD